MASLTPSRPRPSTVPVPGREVFSPLQWGKKTIFEGVSINHSPSTPGHLMNFKTEYKQGEVAMVVLVRGLGQWQARRREEKGGRRLRDIVEWEAAKEVLPRSGAWEREDTPWTDVPHYGIGGGLLWLRRVINLSVEDGEEEQHPDPATFSSSGPGDEMTICNPFVLRHLMTF